MYTPIRNEVIARMEATSYDLERTRAILLTTDKPLTKEQRNELWSLLTVQRVDALGLHTAMRKNDTRVNKLKFWKR